MHPFDIEIISDAVNLTFNNRIEIAAEITHMVLVKFVTDHRKRQRSSVNRELHLFEEIRDPTDMVFMGVSDNNGYNFFADFTQVGEVWDENIDPVHLFIWKTHSDIDDNRFVFSFDNGDISTDLSESSQRSNTDFLIIFKIQFKMGVKTTFMRFLILENKV